MEWTYAAMGAVTLIGTYFQFRFTRDQLRRLRHTQDPLSLFFKSEEEEAGKAIAGLARVILVAALMLYLVASMLYAVFSLFGGGHNVGVSLFTLMLVFPVFLQVLLLSFLKGIVFLVFELVRSFIGPLVLSGTACYVIWQYSTLGVLETPHLVESVLNWLFQYGPGWLQGVYLVFMAVLSVWDSFQSLFSDGRGLDL